MYELVGTLQLELQPADLVGIETLHVDRVLPALVARRLQLFEQYRRNIDPFRFVPRRPLYLRVNADRAAVFAVQ